MSQTQPKGGKVRNTYSYQSFHLLIDIEPPQIPGPASNYDKTTDAGLDTAVVTWTQPRFTDNSGTVFVTSNYNSGDRFPIGTTDVVYSISDASGNSNSMTFSVTVRGKF